MNSENSENQRRIDTLQELIDCQIAGSISDSQFQQLSSLLSDDRELRSVYLAEMELESQLVGFHFAKKPLEFSLAIPTTHTPTSTPTTNSSVKPRLVKSPIRSLLALAASIAIAALVAYPLYKSQTRPGDLGVVQRPVEPAAETVGPSAPTSAQTASVPEASVARITNGLDASWQSEKPLSRGSWLSPGRYLLEKGNVEITFDAGTTVWIAGVAEFEIINANEIRMLKGTLEADVPEQAIGFTVVTPGGEIVDLSTRFSVKVFADGHSDVFVLKGMVEAKPVSAGAASIVTLTEKSATRLSPSAPPEPVEFSREPSFKFGNRSELQSLNYLHFSFDQTSVADGTIPNSGPGGKGRGGTIADQDIENSWLQVDGKVGKSLYFSGEGARLKTQIKGVSNSKPRTVMFWVRINPKAPREHAYSFVTWGKSEINDDPGKKWQIGWNPNYSRKDEGIMGAIRTEFGGGYVIGSTDLRDGRWHHVASVFVGAQHSSDVAATIRHYVDGKLEVVSGSKSMRINTKSDDRTMSIGEYIGSGSDFFGTYKGWIDEFFLFDVALTPDQIVRVMKENRPPNPSEVVLPADDGR